MSAVSSLILVVVVIVGPVLIYWTITKYLGAKMLKSQDFKETYQNSLQQGTRNTFTGYYWRIIICARWTVTCSIMIFLRDYPSFQALTLLSASIFFQSILIYSPPFTLTIDNRMSLFNEIATSVNVYLLLILANADMLKTSLSTSLTSLVSITIGVNSIRALKRIYLHIRSAYR